MAKVLYVWELGAGLGHLSVAFPLLRRMIQEEHEVHLALHSLEKVPLVFGDLPITLWQAPIQPHARAIPYQFPATICHILINTCFRAPDEFPVRIKAWESLFRAIEPDLVLLDHCPSALLAGESFHFTKALIGTGFTVPPRRSLFPSWRPELHLTTEQLQQDEQLLLNRLNQWRERQKLPLDETVSDLFAKVEHHVLMTFPELDPFGPRPTTYHGIWLGLHGSSFQWPMPCTGPNPTKKIVAYLKPNDQIPKLLQVLRDSEAVAVLYVPGIDPGIVQEFQGPKVSFSSTPLDFTQAARECDLAILNATHTSVATFLLQGKPMLLVPLFLEQRLNAEKALAMGAGLMLSPANLAGVGTALHRLLTESTFTQRAQAFQYRYRQFDVARRADQVAAHLLGLL